MEHPRDGQIHPPPVEMNLTSAGDVAESRV